MFAGPFWDELILDAHYRRNVFVFRSQREVDSFFSIPPVKSGDKDKKMTLELFKQYSSIELQLRKQEKRKKETPGGPNDPPKQQPKKFVTQR